ncbi:helix-turn-helix domain-containing protein [Mesorhizobium sp. B2-4-4]|nr:helix-turn-helix domain-containing protein [Mesorhizobium sp. B2-4-4]
MGSYGRPRRKRATRGRPVGYWRSRWLWEGVDRKTAAEICGMDRQTLRDRVHRYQAEGLADEPDVAPPAALG